MSLYELRDRNDVSTDINIITEADRSVTTVMLPGET